MDGKNSRTARTHDRPIGHTRFAIRLACSEDRRQIHELLPRLHAFGEVPLRTAGQLEAGERRTIDRYLDHEPASARLWIAESPESKVLGFAYAESAVDYFTQETHGHLGILAVSVTVEGQGVARALLLTVEEWGRENRFRFLTLNVFAGNTRARHFYAHAGFAPDIIRCLKPLGGG
jgi:ribosomal protein S18 acetylase RimI-like enzyme